MIEATSDITVIIVFKLEPVSWSIQVLYMQFARRNWLYV